MLVGLVDHALTANPDEPLGPVFPHIWSSRNDPSFVPHIMPLPTDAIPGTPEKIAILKARLEAGVMLNHPQDCYRAQ